jgi:hypothetical protein
VKGRIRVEYAMHTCADVKRYMHAHAPKDLLYWGGAELITLPVRPAGGKSVYS